MLLARKPSALVKQEVNNRVNIVKKHIAVSTQIVSKMATIG